MGRGLLAPTYGKTMMREACPVVLRLRPVISGLADDSADRKSGLGILGPVLMNSGEVGDSAMTERNCPVDSARWGATDRGSHQTL